MFTDFTDLAADLPAVAHPPPAGAAADWTVPQRWDRFTDADHRVWDRLFLRQSRKLAGRAVQDFERGIGLLRLGRPGIPDFDDLSERLFARTGWTVAAVPGLLPEPVFFGHLSRRCFPAGNFIRGAASLDYLEEPDVFHDVFGHIPLLATSWFADFMQALGEMGLAATEPDALERLGRFYWHTVEFGLAREGGALKIYGAGLASSFGEAAYALDSPKPLRLPFDLRRAVAQRYRHDAFQPLYYVLDGFDQLRALAGGGNEAALRSLA